MVWQARAKVDKDEIDVAFKRCKNDETERCCEIDDGDDDIPTCSGLVV